MQHIVLLRVFKGVGLHLHHSGGFWHAPLWGLPALPLRAPGLQRDGQAVLLQHANEHVLCKLEPVLYELHPEGVQPVPRDDIVRQYRTGMGGDIFGKYLVTMKQGFY